MTQVLASPVDPDTTALLLESLPVPPGASEREVALRRQSALEMVAVLRPRDPVEAAMAARVVAAHYGVMDSFRCAVQPELPARLMIQHQGRALALSRLMDVTLTALERRQAMRPALRAVAAPEVRVAKAEPVKAAAPVPVAPPAAVKPAAPVPAASPLAVPAAKPGAPLTPVQQEQLRRDLARRAETSLTALATVAA